jgi:hypothetical protein
MTTRQGLELNRRGLLLAAGTIAAAANLTVAHAQTPPQQSGSGNTPVSELGRRKLGSLEVSSVGLGSYAPNAVISPRGSPPDRLPKSRLSYILPFRR